MSLTDYLASRANKIALDSVENYTVISRALLKNDERGISQNVSAENVARYHS